MEGRMLFDALEGIRMARCARMKLWSLDLVNWSGHLWGAALLSSWRIEVYGIGDGSSIDRCGAHYCWELGR